MARKPYVRFFAAATVTLVYLIVQRLTKNGPVGIIASLLLAFSDIFWSQAVRAETYTLHTFFLALVIFFLILWDEKEQLKWLYIAAFTVGLSLGNQHLMFLAGIPIILFVLIRAWKTVLKPKIVLIGLLLFTAGLSTYAYLPIRTAVAPYENPSYIHHEGLHDWDTFFRFINRNIYGGTVDIVENTEETASGSWHVIEGLAKLSNDLITNNIKGFIPFFEKVFEQSFFVTLLFIIPGFLYLTRKKKISYGFSGFSCSSFRSFS